MDINSDFWLSGECKDYANNLPGPEMKKILIRIPGKSHLNVVYTSGLQRDYFNKTKRKGVKDTYPDRESRFRAFVQECGNPFILECAFRKVENG
jgi:hypothetical protein